jgi:hypothetical protein
VDEVILICQWYEAGDETRRSELAAARQANRTSGVFEAIHYVDGTAKRLTYGEIISLASRKFPGKVCVLANSDILFNESACCLRTVAKPSRIISLTRWENDSTPNMVGHLVGPESWTRNEYKFFSGSQDAWAFVSGSLPDMSIDIPMGRVGCDQVFLGWAAKSGCEVLNPSFDVRTRHIHASHADYSQEPSMEGLYGYPEMTTLAGGVGLVLTHEMPLKDPQAVEFIETWPR